ncbi:MAG: transporter substrate-binding domain-containing protein [Aedoeadaptatus pacaensis]
MKKFFKFAAILCALTMILTACGGQKNAKNNEADAGDAKDGKKTITVAANNSFFPVIYTNDEGELEGFEHDLWVEIGKRAGYEIKFEPMGDYAAMFESLDSGKVDTIAGQISVTPEREEKYPFSDIYSYNAIKLAVRGDDPAQSIDDMQGRKVCIEFGTELENMFNEINEKYPEGKKIELVTTEGNIYEELKTGHYDGFPITVLSFDQINEKGDYNFKLIGDPLKIDKTAFPFKKDADPEMVKAVNKAIEEMKEDGTLSKLSEQYYKRDVTQEQITE